MKTSAYHHVAVRVTDIEVAGAFSIGGFGGEPGGGLAAEGGQRFFLCEDPDGNAIEVCSSTIEDSIARLLAGWLDRVSGEGSEAVLAGTVELA